MHANFNFIETSAKENINIDRMLLKMFSRTHSLSLPSIPKHFNTSPRLYSESFAGHSTVTGDSESDCEVGEEDGINELPIMKCQEDTDRFKRSILGKDECSTDSRLTD